MWNYFRSRIKAFFSSIFLRLLPENSCNHQKGFARTAYKIIGFFLEV